MTNMKKVASEVPAIMQTAAQHMRKLASSNQSLMKRASAAEHELRLMKLARRMEQRGLEPEMDFEEKVAALREFDEEKLASFAQAIEMAAGGARLGSLDNADNTNTKRASHGERQSSDELEDFVTTQGAFN
jgi:hypothetical protein